MYLSKEVRRERNRFKTLIDKFEFITSDFAGL